MLAKTKEIQKERDIEIRLIGSIMRLCSLKENKGK